MDILDKLKITAPAGVSAPDSRIDGGKILRESITDLEKKPSPPPLAISIGDPPDGSRWRPRFATFGNISLIKGHEKTRKSFAKSLLLGCAIGGKANMFSERIKGHDLKDKWIFDIDTEQGDWEVWMNASRIPKMCGYKPENYLSIALRKYSARERMGFLEWLFMESEYRKNLGFVFLDGYVDFLEDFNDLKESKRFTEKLMKYTAETNCHISGILHLNPGTEKGRGHLGTVLQQKCETVVIIKNHGGYSEFVCQSARGQSFENFNFKVNSEYLPEEYEDGKSWLDS